MSTQEVEQAKAEAFAGKMLGVLNGAATALAVSVGHRTGLFDQMAGMRPSTSEQVAQAAGLTERYVREWLNGMVVGGIVEYDQASRTYSLPSEHAAAVTRAAGPGNIAALTQFIPMLGVVEDGIVEAFHEGGGVPYSGFANFTKLMAEGSAARFDLNLVEVQIPLVPGIVPRLEAGIDVADMGCGSGHAINLMARQWPKSRFTGFDFSEEGIAAARKEADVSGLTNASFEVADIPSIQGGDRFDLVITFDAVHDQADPAAMLATVSRVLRAGGHYVCADIRAATDVGGNLEHPLGPFGYTVSLFHCMTVSLEQGGAGLGAMWGEQKALEMLGEAGFSNVSVKQVEGDILNNYYIATKA